MMKTRKPTVVVHYAPGCEPKPMTRWERLVDRNMVCHLLWSYNFTGRKMWRESILDLRCMGVLR